MRKWSVVGILALAQFVMVLDSTVMNVSISAVVDDLGTTVNALQGAITFYTLTMAALMLIGAKLCSKWGLLRAFVIGSIVYGLGSFITGISQNITQLTIGWSIIEGLGAVLVIPAIAALIAVNYKGKDRILGFAIIGGISGAAAAAGPLIGGFVTTYLSWRYVFIAETIVMIIVLIASRKFKSQPGNSTIKIDFLSAVLSAVGLLMIVYAMLQSKVWGWVQPLNAPVINGQELTPLGISIVAYLILFGFLLLVLFYYKQLKLEHMKANPLLRVSMLKIAQLRSGLLVLMSQYVITAAVFFVVPVYLQMVQGYDALKTGLKILPLSIALIVFSVIGSRLTNNFSPKQIARLGQYLLILGVVFLLWSIKPELTGIAFGSAMFAIGAGLGLLASQLGSVNMSAVQEDASSEVGGMQGTFQNLGSSFGTAVIGSVLISALTAGFIANISASNLPQTAKDSIVAQSQKGIQVASTEDVEQYVLQAGASQSEADEVTSSYEQAQIAGLKQSIFAVLVLSVLSLLLSKHIPTKKVS